MIAKARLPEDPEVLAETYRLRWQRVLKAYLALREVRTLSGSQAHTPVLARLLSATEDLRPDDLKVLQ